MKKSELRTGMITKDRDGTLRVVLKCTAAEDRYAGIGGSLSLKYSRGDLTHVAGIVYLDIMEVWSGFSDHGIIMPVDWENTKGRLLWAREYPPEIKLTVGGKEITLSNETVATLRNLIPQE